MRIARSVRELVAYTPGEQPRSRDVVKLNTNENPYPPSPACAKALARLDLDRLRRYPDPMFNELRDELARLNGCRRENIFVGNGSDEVLSLAAKAFVEDAESIASLDPSYSLYRTLAAIRNVPWTGVSLASVRGDPSETAACLARLAQPAALFLWTNPNAPTGEAVNARLISAFAKNYPGTVLVDEAYADFARDNCMKLATRRGNANLLVMRTFSKSYSLAGLRVGYAVGPKELIDALYKVKDSYNVDAVAQALALAAVRDQKWMRRNVERVVKTRTRFTAELIRRGWDVLPSETNFVFARPNVAGADADARHAIAAALFDHLRARNIFVRYFPGEKTGDRLRITIGTDAQMKKLLAAIDE